MTIHRSLKQSILSLPIDVQILIHEFNHEHRNCLKQLHQEYITLIYPPCKVCQKPFDGEFTCIDYFIIAKYKIRDHWCTSDCFHEDKDTIGKIRCLMAIDSYVNKN